MVDAIFLQATQTASLRMLDAVTLPEGTIKEGREAEVNNAYQTLSVSHQLQRATTYLHLASLVPDAQTAKRLRFYAKQELLSVQAWIVEIRPMSDFAKTLEQGLARLEDALDEPADIRLTKTSLKGNHLVLVTDLYRDYDDWLTLLHVIISGKYEKITLLTSNEVAGECAKTTESFLPSLILLAKTLHHKDFDIQVFQGLPAFDFAALHPDYQSQCLGVHYPDKSYSATMRVKPPAHLVSVKQYEDLFQILPSWRELQTDVVSIGKLADLNILSQLATSQGVKFNNLTVLGCKPNSISTNTNGPAYHLQCLPPEATLLDSRYGNGPEFVINKATFSDLFNVSEEHLLEAISQSISVNQHNTVELYFKELLRTLAQLSRDNSLSSDEKKSLLLLIKSSLDHLSNLNYSRGNTFDLFTLLADQVPSVPQTIYFTIRPEEPNKAKCLYTLPDDLAAGTVVHSVKVNYPDKDKMHRDFLNYLQVLIKPLQQRSKEQKDRPFALTENQSNQQKSTLSMHVLRSFVFALGAGSVALAFVVLGPPPADAIALTASGLAIAAGFFGLFRTLSHRTSEPLNIHGVCPDIGRH